jgi:hypothetical protein
MSKKEREDKKIKKKAAKRSADIQKAKDKYNWGQGN